MSSVPCSIDGCDKSDRIRRGMCNKHYLAWRAQNVLPQCSIQDCTETARARTWCDSHYKTWRRHGDPEARLQRRLPPQNLPRTLGCKIIGCEEKHNAKGYCKDHYMQARYVANKDRINAGQLEYRKRNRDQLREASRQWNINNPDKARAVRASQYLKNRDERLASQKRYRRLNPDKTRAANNRRRARELNVTINDLTADQWVEIKESWGGRCAYCGVKPVRLTMDHYVPVSKGGNHTASNIVPACLSCNARKGDRQAPPFYFQRTA